MNQIFKYALRVADGPQAIEMPGGARILCVQNQHGNLALWALVDDSLKPDRRKFFVVGTGQDFDENMTQYIGTAQIGAFVWHVFEDFRT